MLIFVTGGVRSGKSSFAEHLAIAIRTNKLHYVATSIAYDHEMEARLALHRQAREISGADWITWEEPYDISRVHPHVTKDDVVLLDCLTTFASNRLFIGWERNEKRYEEAVFRRKVYHSILNDIRTLSSNGKLIIVSNEVHFEQVSQDIGTFYYTKLLGGLHQQIVIDADEAYEIQFGIPKKWKG